MKRKLHTPNNNVTVIIDVSFTESTDVVNQYIRDEQCPVFFNLKDEGIIRFEWFINEEDKTATLIEKFENSNVWEELGNKVIGSPINLRFRELFKVEKLTVLGEINDEFDDDGNVYSKLDDKNYVFEGKTFVSYIELVKQFSQVVTFCNHQKFVY